jgi:Flp pilus assembly protein TadG
MKRIGAGRTFLGRLARDIRGNTIALMAAAMMPLAGLIGGGVDMSRLYLTKTRLQQACDAGALAGRKAMGAGAWTTGNATTTNGRAEAMFAANFLAGDYGTGTLTKSFTEANGVVTGTSTVVVPMTIMKMFGMSTRTIRVTCTAKMEIPNTDVMFVLDVTGSMMCSAGTAMCFSPASPSKLDGLKSAVKCFYEALLKVNTAEVCGNDPTASVADTTAQIRLGFVPYSVNVNVGRLLPNSYLADSWPYQTRVATTGTVQAWTLGSESAISWDSWSATPDSFSNTSGYGSFTLLTGNDNDPYTMADGSVFTRRNTSATGNTSCNNLNTYGSANQMVGVQETYGTTGSTSTSATDNNPPVYPASVQNRSASRTRTASVTYGYRYIWTSSKCYLHRAAKTTSWGADDYTQTQTGTATKPITWTAYANVITGWSYQQASLDVSALKTGGSNWAASVALPIGSTSGATVYPSGSSSSTTLQIAANSTVTWDGCIEERQTYQNTNGSPQNDWNPIPASAYDLNIDLIPSATAGTKWGPMLGDATWGPYTAKSCSWLGCTYTRPATNAAYASTEDLDHNNNYSCPTAARKLTVYNTADSLVSYVNGFAAGGATYHDVGMVWGARLLSPTGLFAAENAFTPSGRAIQRHLIFMTDGDTNTSSNDYSAYGMGFWSRRQTSYAATDTQTDDMLNARLTSLCTAIKNMNVTLWVVSYGGNVNEDTEARLSACATPGRFYSASDNAALISRFRQIASEISELRLTS